MSCNSARVPQGLRSIGIFSLIAFSVVVAGAQPAGPREFPPGVLQRLEQLPAGRLRRQIEGLPAQARERAVAWLRSFHFTELDLQSLEVDRDGGIYYADEFAINPAAEEAMAEPVVAQAAVSASPFPAGLVFHSKPGAPNTLYLNFAGENVRDTAWNSSVGRSLIAAVPFSTDSDYSTFSDGEQAAIKRVWQRVAEDYAPFNIDVTTQRPASFGPRTAHAVVTRTTDANGYANPSSTGGGVAYVNVFGAGNFTSYQPAWIYFNNLGNNESYIAEAASHEVGHNLGLSHDGKTDGTAYYGGHGNGDTSWGPIMGTGYGRNVSQWSKGEYYLANNTQDDLNTIAGKIAYRGDDHGDTSAAATSLLISGGTNVLSTTPEIDPVNANSANKGILQNNADVDVFSFVTGSGAINLMVKPWVAANGTRGGNLDVVLELRNSTGTLLLTNDAPTLTTAQIQTNLAAGTYYLYVRNTGVGNPLSSTPSGYTRYGSIGQYFITGVVAPPTAATDAQLRLSMTRGPNRATILNWNTTVGRVYTVWWSTNLSAPWAVLPGASNLPATVQSFTNAYNPARPAAFYRVESR